MYKLYTLHLRERINSLTLPYDWLLWNSNDNSVHFLRPTYVNAQLLLESSMSIDSSLNVKAKRGTYAVPLSLNIIDDTRQIELLLKEVMDFQIPSGTLDQPIEDQLNVYLHGAITQIKFAIAEYKNLDLDSDTLLIKFHQISTRFNSVSNLYSAKSKIPSFTRNVGDIISLLKLLH